MSESPFDTSPAIHRARCLIAAVLNAAGQEWTPRLRVAISRHELFGMDGRLQILAKAIDSASANGVIPGGPSIYQLLPKEHRGLLSSFLPVDALPLSTAEVEAETFLKTALPASIASTITEAAQAVVADPDQTRAIARTLTCTLAQLETEAGAESLIERLAKHLYRPDVRIEKPAPRFSIGRVTVCTAANLTTLSGQAKHGKSSIVQAMIASTFSGVDSDTFGFVASNPNGHALIHLDCEQSPYDHQAMVELTLRRAGKPLPPWVSLGSKSTL